MNETAAIKGSRPRELPRPNRTYKTGRVCAQEGCETRISMYNKAPYCWTHTPMKFPLVRGERKKKAAA
ncbi:MAG TPA: hypothetical protein VGR49_03925 [Actinomycetota bacterium]|jgi:hypothetical protein|nr:hypothetical protein [Actinomycetota bacterium]